MQTLWTYVTPTAAGQRGLENHFQHFFEQPPVARETHGGHAVGD